MTIAYRSLSSGGQSKTANQSSITASLPAGTDSGDLVVVAVACDNNQTTDGDEGAVTSITDALGNTYAKALEFCNGQGSAQAGVTISVWYSNVTTGTVGAQNITINLSNNTSRDATNNHVHVFSKGTLGGVAATASVADDAADPGSLNPTTANMECLRYRATARELTGGTYTATGGWSSATQQTTGTPATSNIQSAVEWKVSTGTGDASDPSWASTGDCASVYVAFWEVAATADLAKTLDAASLSGAAAVSVQGAGAATFAAATLSGAAAVSVQGEGAATLGALALAGDGVVTSAGATADLAVTLEALSLGAGAGALVQGVGSATLGAVTLGGAGAVEVQGAGAATLGAVGLSADASVAVQGQATAQLAPLAASADGAVLVQAGSALTLASLGITTTAGALVQGGLAATLAALTGSSSGAVAPAAVEAVVAIHDDLTALAKLSAIAHVELLARGSLTALATALDGQAARAAAYSGPVATVTTYDQEQA